MQPIFLNDIPVYIIKDLQVPAVAMQYDHFLLHKAARFSIPIRAGHVLVRTDQAHFERLLRAIHQLTLAKPLSITIWVEESQDISKLLVQSFKLVKAAGGVVIQGDQTLMIRRLGKWDLPKGKLEEGEQPMEAATREVAEECGIQARPIRKVCSTWHSYIWEQESIVLKETTWYAMACVNDLGMQPQLEEGIEMVAWMRGNELDGALQNSYATIRHVLQSHHSYEASSLSAC